MENDYDIDYDLDLDTDGDDFDYGWEDEAYGFEDYEPSPYDGTYSEE